MTPSRLNNHHRKCSALNALYHLICSFQGLEKLPSYCHCYNNRQGSPWCRDGIPLFFTFSRHKRGLWGTWLFKALSEISECTFMQMPPFVLKPFRMEPCTLPLYGVICQLSTAFFYRIELLGIEELNGHSMLDYFTLPFTKNYSSKNLHRWTKPSRHGSRLHEDLDWFGLPKKSCPAALRQQLCATRYQSFSIMR